mmetsp:Transcript_7540/g.22894  ORF Transcript_7540/g.22894 Transcript_7540/m.22894 type:complete len:314 (+) Transcript_7540:381-1322(+)
MACILHYKRPTRKRVLHSSAARIPSQRNRIHLYNAQVRDGGAGRVAGPSARGYAAGEAKVPRGALRAAGQQDSRQELHPAGDPRRGGRGRPAALLGPPADVRRGGGARAVPPPHPRRRGGGGRERVGGGGGGRHGAVPGRPAPDRGAVDAAGGLAPRLVEVRHLLLLLHRGGDPARQGAAVHGHAARQGDEAARGPHHLGRLGPRRQLRVPGQPVPAQGRGVGLPVPEQAEVPRALRRDALLRPPVGVRRAAHGPAGQHRGRAQQPGAGGHPPARRAAARLRGHPHVRPGALGRPRPGVAGPGTAGPGTAGPE